jgi:YHS domain-containing protein
MGLMRWVMVSMVMVWMVVLTGCGTRYATMRGVNGEDLMLLGHDPVAYFTVGKPTRGYPNIREDHDGVTFYFASEDNRALFRKEPAKYFPQYGAYCSSGAAFAIKLGHDPTEFIIRNGKIYFFGDVLGKEAWLLDPDWNIKFGDQTWPEAKDTGWRWQSLKRYANKVSWYKTGKDIRDEFASKYPGRQWPDFDPGGMVTNLFLKDQGWRAREGFGQPAVGLVGVDPCPPACPGTVSKAFGEK